MKDALLQIILDCGAAKAAYLSVDHMGVHAKYVAGRELF